MPAFAGMTTGRGLVCHPRESGGPASRRGAATRVAAQSERLAAASWMASLPGFVLKLVVGALPVREVSTMRPAFLDPDAMSALPNAMLVGLAQELDRRRTIAR